jgi:hypothetical protein
METSRINRYLRITIRMYRMHFYYMLQLHRFRMLYLHWNMLHVHCGMQRVHCGMQRVHCGMQHAVFA